MPKCHDTSYEKGNFLQHYIQPSEFDIDEFQDPRDYFGLTRHLLWYMFLNEYEDGYIEWGEFEVCHDKMGFGFLADSEGNVRIARDNISCELEDLGNENPFTGRIDLHFEDEESEFTPDPKGKMPILLKRYPPTPQQEGWWHRKGETRKPVAHFAWGETERVHGLDCHEKLPTRE